MNWFEKLVTGVQISLILLMVALTVVQLAPRPVSIQDNSSIEEVTLQRHTWNPLIPVNQSITQGRRARFPLGFILSH